jgi:hypothetical protein
MEQTNTTQILTDVTSDSLFAQKLKSANFDRAIFTRALNEENFDRRLSCLPNSQGVVDTTPAVNFVTGTKYSLPTTLKLKAVEKTRGYHSGNWATKEQLAKVQSEMPDLGKFALKYNEKPIVITQDRLNTATGYYDPECTYLYNLEQTTNPQGFASYAQSHGHLQEQQKNSADRGATITCNSSDPADYLATYAVALQTGAAFRVANNVAADFKQYIGDAIYAKQQSKRDPDKIVCDPFALNIIYTQAAKKAREIIEERTASPKAEPTLPGVAQSQKRKGQSINR